MSNAGRGLILALHAVLLRGAAEVSLRLSDRSSAAAGPELLLPGPHLPTP